MKMHFSRSSLALLALPTATFAVSLSDFRPYATDLPEACDAVYRSKVDCQPEDFTGKDGCSKSCVRSLQSLVPKVQKACGDEDIGEGNIIYQFLGGNGPRSLCDNADTVLGGMSSGSSSATETTAAVSSSKSRPSSIASSTEAPSSSENATSSTAMLSGTATATSLAPSDTASSSGGLLVDTGSATSSQTSTATSYGGQSNDNPSNGGSPFDSANPGMSAATAASLSTSTTFCISVLTFLALLG